MLDRPVSGRVFFEQVIRDDLGAGRPDQVSLILSRRIETRRKRPHPGRFRTRILTSGVTPAVVWSSRLLIVLLIAALVARVKITGPSRLVPVFHPAVTDRPDVRALVGTRGLRQPP
jgi:hypothetical protein